MALRFDIGARTVLVLCDDCPPWWAFTIDGLERAERLALEHAWAVHDRPTANRMTDTIYRRQTRRTGGAR
jgi:hypothetical protein